MQRKVCRWLFNSTRLSFSILHKARICSTLSTLNLADLKNLRE